MTKITMLFMLGALSLYANEADVLKVIVNCDASKNCRFDVTIKHNDTGWKDYANKFKIIAPDGEILGTRVLFHPHVNEQPFTRSISNVKIPKGVKSVKVKAYESLHKYNGKEFKVNLQ